MHTKRDLRQVQKQKLQAYQGPDRLTEETALRAKLFNTAQWAAAKTIAVVLSTPMELNTQPIIGQAWANGKQVVVPKIVAKQMQFVAITPQTAFTAGALNIQEPEEDTVYPPENIDLVIVPGLAYTKQGGRLGFGAGYYDRFLSTYTGQTIALALTPQLLETLPLEPHDQVIDQVLTR
ncbi:5-formyltetrahydrofolate cyclo-ligase [Leuconostoc lactis]|uniref:5-formyltetrahydrofolate cyclo-ligase n=1 Tax=Leuconostoc lactis TaxID=1246 RepID=UPI0028A7C06B|nr:5-formyltetrahydrofolate cyclo-ligase [Leuconostoc lactis]